MAYENYGINEEADLKYALAIIIDKFGINRVREELERQAVRPESPDIGQDLWQKVQ